MTKKTDVTLRALESASLKNLGVEISNIKRTKDSLEKSK